MNIRRIKRLLWALATAISGAAVAIVILALWWPYDQPTPYAVQKPSLRPVKSDKPSQPMLQDFAGIWARNLRPPLIDPPSERPSGSVAEDKPVIVSRPNLRLIGYTVEPQHALAILIGQQGTTEYIAVGEKLDGVTVVAISSAGVQLDHNGDEYTLKFDEESSAPPPRLNDARRVERPLGQVGRYR